jgi:hypothetical protein
MIRYHIQGKKGKISGTSVAVRYHRYLKRFLRRRFPLVAFFAFARKKQPSYSRSGRVSQVLCAKIGDKIHLDSKAFGRLLERCKSAVFYQTGRYFGVFSTRTETDGFAGFSGTGRGARRGNGA